MLFHIKKAVFISIIYLYLVATCYGSIPLKVIGFQDFCIPIQQYDGLNLLSLCIFIVGCSNALDATIVLDSSGSIGEGNWQEMKVCIPRHWPSLL